MKTIRAFIAIEISPASKLKISELIDQLKRSGSDVKWVNDTQMHLTLKFLGNIEQDKIPEISGALKDIASKAVVFQIIFSGIGAFPDINRPRVIWLGIEKGADNLKKLAGHIEDKMKNLGFTKEGRCYKAHLTLGRVRSQKNIQELAKNINETYAKTESTMKINRLILFQSTLTPKGAIYTLLQEFPLSKK
ncbi:MAG: RNA 2',3'-cyclic phosphodiesterase [Candidatus Omnitrophica bacterium]|nr:RNA 2',3'-cyclic phosphodiesterase [Candidatus Omnitrophota bacterium]MBU4148843.1 RNA 2',3'-cyclic phosphodiesterase [Candidatus Omnitrophota bacterium]